MAEYEFFVRDASLQRVAQLSDFRRLDVVLRWNAVGSWLIEVPAATAASEALLATQAGLEVVRDGVTLLSGPHEHKDRQWADGDHRTFAGPDDTVWLKRRLALPVPAGPPYTSAAYDVRTGVAESIMRQYVDANAGPSAKTERRVTGLTLAADGGRGTSLTGRARFETLLELLQGLALASRGASTDPTDELGFRILQVGTTLQFQVYEGADLTDTAVFSEEMGNLSDHQRSEDAPEATYVVVGGDGDGTWRVFHEGGDSEAIVQWGRIEAFLDQRGISLTAELAQALAQALAEKARKEQLQISPIDTPAVAFGADYGLGDLVRAVADDVEVIDLVREVRITVDENGEKVSPVIGTPGPPGVAT